MAKFHNISVDFSRNIFKEKPYIQGGLDVSLYGCGNAVSVDATGYRKNKTSTVEIHIAESMCLVLDGTQANNLLECLKEALNSENGKENIIKTGEINNGK
jgi:hypothetical protein